MPTTIYPNNCSKCNKSFEAPFPSSKKLPAYCKDCTKLFQTIGQLQRKLVAENFSIEQKDEEITRQINALLVKEKLSGVSKKNEELLTALTERLVADEKRRKKILRHLLRLQKKKK